MTLVLGHTERTATQHPRGRIRSCRVDCYSPFCRSSTGSTAAAVLKLRDEGKLDLDADLTDYLPDYPTQGHRISVRRLLDHTSGIKGMTVMEGFGAPRPQQIPRDSVVTLFASQPFDFDPGEDLIYNNSAYFVLGLNNEEASGMSYEDYGEKGVVCRVGHESFQLCSNIEVVASRAHGYQFKTERSCDGLTLVIRCRTRPVLSVQRWGTS